MCMVKVNLSLVFEFKTLWTPQVYPKLQKYVCMFQILDMESFKSDSKYESYIVLNLT